MIARNGFLFFAPSKTDGRVLSQQGAPTTCNLTFWKVSQRKYVQTLLASLGVVIGQNSALQWEEGGSITNWVWPREEIHRFSVCVCVCVCGGGGGGEG